MKYITIPTKEKMNRYLCLNCKTTHKTKLKLERCVRCGKNYEEY